MCLAREEKYVFEHTKGFFCRTMENLWHSSINIGWDCWTIAFCLIWFKSNPLTKRPLCSEKDSQDISPTSPITSRFRCVFKCFRCYVAACMLLLRWWAHKVLKVIDESMPQITFHESIWCCISPKMFLAWALEKASLLAVQCKPFDQKKVQLLSNCLRSDRKHKRLELNTIAITQYGQNVIFFTFWT